MFTEHATSEEATFEDTNRSFKWSAKSVETFGISWRKYVQWIVVKVFGCYFYENSLAYRKVPCHWRLYKWFYSRCCALDSSSQQITSKYFNFVFCKPLACFWLNASRMSFALYCVAFVRVTIECIYNLQFVNAVETCTLLTTHFCQKPETGIVCDCKKQRIRKMNINQYVKQWHVRAKFNCYSILISLFVWLLLYVGTTR